MKVKSKQYFYFTDFFSKIYSRLTHVRKTRPLRSHYYLSCLYLFQNPWSPVEEYKALIIDWQGVAYDLLSGDLLWTLYGFSKNLPDKNTTVESWMDYSIHFYHQELLRYLNLMHVDMSKLNLPEHEHDAKTLIR